MSQIVSVIAQNLLAQVQQAIKQYDEQSEQKDTKKEIRLEKIRLLNSKETLGTITPQEKIKLDNLIKQEKSSWVKEEETEN